MIEAKKITLSICNENVEVSINPELEAEYRQTAKRVSDEFAKYKECYPDVEKYYCPLNRKVVSPTP